MKAVVITESRTAELSDIREQSMRPDYIKVRTVAVGVNPSTIIDRCPQAMTDGLQPIFIILRLLAS